MLDKQDTVLGYEFLMRRFFLPAVERNLQLAFESIKEHNDVVIDAVVFIPNNAVDNICHTLDKYSMLSDSEGRHKLPPAGRSLFSPDLLLDGTGLNRSGVDSNSSCSVGLPDRDRGISHFVSRASSTALGLSGWVFEAMAELYFF